MGDVSPYGAQIFVHLEEMDRETGNVIGHLQRDVEETYNLGVVIFQAMTWPFSLKLRM